MKNEIKITKEEHLLTTEQKRKFCGYGEWLEEVDIIEFEYLGYCAKIKRTFVKELFAKEEAYFGGHLCGYVKIPKEHPFYGKDYDDINIDTHGGLTFGEINEEHWIGYDCGHSGDYIPTMEYVRRTDPGLIAIREMFPLPKNYKSLNIFNPKYRNIEYCTQICIEMIEQLAGVKVNNEV